MSSQSAKLRTTHGTVAGRTPLEDHKVSDMGARKGTERVSWVWVAPIVCVTWAFLVYVVPALAEFLAAVLAP